MKPIDGGGLAVLCSDLVLAPTHVQPNILNMSLTFAFNLPTIHLPKSSNTVTELHGIIVEDIYYILSSTSTSGVAPSPNLIFPQGLTCVGLVVPGSDTPLERRCTVAQQLAQERSKQNSSTTIKVVIFANGLVNDVYVSKSPTSNTTSFEQFDVPSKPDPKLLSELSTLRCQVTFDLPVLHPSNTTNMCSLRSCVHAETKQLIQNIESFIKSSTFLLSSNDAMIVAKDTATTLSNICHAAPDVPSWQNNSSTGNISTSTTSSKPKNNKNNKNKKGKKGKKGKGGKGKGKKKKSSAPSLYEEENDQEENPASLSTGTSNNEQNDDNTGSNAAPVRTTPFGETVSIEMLPMTPTAKTSTNSKNTKTTTTPPTNGMDVILTTLHLTCDVVCIAHDSLTLSEIHTHFTTGIQQQIQQLTNQLLEHLEKIKDTINNKENILKNLIIETLLFCSNEYSIPIGATFVTLLNETEKETVIREEPLRSSLHDFTSALRVPTFRRACAWTSSNNTINTNNTKNTNNINNINHSIKLLNIHQHCPPPPEIVNDDTQQGYTMHMVSPGYRYYHYMQDKYNDKGWGCAYRSLQTLWSWYELHSYTTLAPLNHEEIQKTLVRVDPTKHSSFVGSQEWIGSQGVGYVLDDQLDVTSKFIFVPSGNELKSKARALAQHFDTQGTPIMMGGGALAFTILGVAWHQGTGDMSMLILDPHYCGQDNDMNNIVGKEAKLEGYKAKPCGWRRPESFEASAFYNLCCPQRKEGCI